MPSSLSYFPLPYLRKLALLVIYSNKKAFWDVPINRIYLEFCDSCIF